MPCPKHHHFEITIPVFWSDNPVVIKGSWVVALMLTLAASVAVNAFFL